MSFIAIFTIVQAVAVAFAGAAGPGADGTGGIISAEVQTMIYKLLGVTGFSTVAAHSLMQTKIEQKVEKTADKVDSAVQEVVEVRRAQALMSSYPTEPKAPYVRKP